MHASFNVFSLPQLSIIKPPVMPPNGATITIALAKIKEEMCNSDFPKKETFKQAYDLRKIHF